MKKYFLAAMMIAATMSVNAKTPKTNALQAYDNLFETVDNSNENNVLDFYNKNASVEAKASFYMFALDRYYASHKKQISKDCPDIIAGYKTALKEAVKSHNETSMKKWCHATEDNFSQAIYEAADVLHD